LELGPGFEALWEQSFSSKNRNSTRKAEKAGIEVGRAEDVGAYHALYAAASRGWGYSDPPYPRALLDALMDSGYAELWLGRLEGNPIAGALLLRGSHDVFYWSGAVAAEHRTIAPGNAVIKAAIKSACDRGLAYFDFGASTGLPGVAAFKESFGAAEVRYATVELTSRRYGVAAAGQRMLARIKPRARSVARER
jgi:CelD/BcsL family acetyltransferase involved in cellulose biosynthesis